MKTFAIISFILAVLSGAFGYWGMFTESGSHYFDEMDGLIPWGFLLLSMIFLAVSVILMIVSYFKKS